MLVGVLGCWIAPAGAWRVYDIRRLWQYEIGVLGAPGRGRPHTRVPGKESPWRCPPHMLRGKGVEVGPNTRLLIR